MLVDLKLYAVSLCVLVLCAQTLTRCKMNAERCKKKGGQCYRQNEDPSGVPILKDCRGICKCYKEVGKIPPFPGAMANMTNMMSRMNMTNMMNMFNMTNTSNMTDDGQHNGNRTAQKRTGYSCNTNAWDKPQHCKCMPGKRISKIESEHDNHYEDRRWTLTCEDIIPSEIARHTNWAKPTETSENEYDGEFWWNGISTNSYMVGMKSKHDNHKEDRKYTVFYSHADNWVLTSCSRWQGLNSYDEKVYYVLGPTQVISALHSHHNNHKEDRKFFITVCDLVPKCGQLVNITYDYEKMTTTETKVTVAKGIFDNRHSSSENSVSAFISYAEQNWLADTYTFSRTSGWSTMGSLEVRAGYNWGVAVAGGSFGVTAGFSFTYETSNTWTRSQTKKFVDTHSSGVTYTANCKAGCYCELLVKMTHGKGQIPYTMYTKSKGGSDNDVCKEEGMLNIKRAWTGEGQSVDESCWRQKGNRLTMDNYN